MDFTFNPNFKIEDIFTPYLITALAIMAFIGLVCGLIGSRVKRLKLGEKPGKIVASAIAFVGWINNFVKTNVGVKAWKWVTPNVITLALVIGLFNLSGLLALDTPTKYVAITVPLAVFAIGVVQITGFISKKGKHLLSSFEPVPFLFPINFIGEFTPIISMSLRLFGNIISGAILASMIYEGLSWFAPLIMPAFHMVFDVAFGFIQTMLFVILTTIFSSNKVDEKDLLII